MSARLKEMLRIAQAATKGPWIAAARPSSVVGWPVVQTGVGRSVCNVTFMPPAAHPDNAEFNATSGANALHIATFNPRTAEALVKVAMALEEISNWRERDKGPLMGTLVRIDEIAADALSALTAAMEDSNVG